MKKLANIGFAALGMLAATPVLAADPVNIGLDKAQDIGLGTADIRTTIAGMIKSFMGLLGIVAVILILFGGFKYMTSQGEQAKVDEAKKIIISGVIGLAIILSAYAIAQFAINSIQNGTA